MFMFNWPRQRHVMSLLWLKKFYCQPQKYIVAVSRQTWSRGLESFMITVYNLYL